MSNKKPFIVFEGIEGSGKSYHSNNLIKEIKKKKLSFIYLREPGGTANAELIRQIILSTRKNNLSELTDTLLYLASRNENFIKNIKPFYKKKIIICDRFSASTLAYQHYGLGVNKNLILYLNKFILGNISPDLTFLMKINIETSLKRLKKRKKLNRYDKFNRVFYKRVQDGFLKISKSNLNKYMIINSENSILENKKIILDKFKLLINE